MNSRRQPSLPPKITGFEYVGLLGMGGFADVFEYRQDFPRRPVAVKVLLDSSLDAGSRDAFFAEANIMAGLSQHPSIVTIHQAAIASDGRPYFIMEYCARPSLGARFRTERISVAETLRTGVRVASAVETAHRLGVLHRDIKPANILATDFGWPALTDFGIAGAVGEQLVASGMSIPWAPPELLADEPFGDARSDVYSLAATLYSLLAGRSPFEVPGKSNAPIDLITRIEREPLKSVDRVDVPQSLNLILARAMAKDPSHRFSSALAFAHALQNVEREMQLPVTGIDVTDIQASSAAPVAQSREAESGADSNQPSALVPENTHVTDSSPRDPVPKPPEETDPEEATRIRGLTTVEAQEEPVVLASDVETRLRPVTTVRADEPETDSSLAPHAWSPAAAKEALVRDFEPQEFEQTTGSLGYFYAKRQQADQSDQGMRRRMTALITLASILLLVLILLFIGNRALGRHEAPQTPEPEPTATQSLDTGSVPAVTGLKVSDAYDTMVRFEWNNPDPQPDDAYVWRIIDVNSHTQNTRTTETFVEVPRETAEQQICIEVSIARANGKMSSTPARECN